MEEYVIILKISTDKPLVFNDVPTITKECLDKGLATVMSAETYLERGDRRK